MAFFFFLVNRFLLQLSFAHCSRLPVAALALWPSQMVVRRPSTELSWSLSDAVQRAFAPAAALQDTLISQMTAE